MLLLIVSTIVSLLIFFFEQWWLQHHPTRPTPEVKAAFLKQIEGWKYFWMGPNRIQYASELFDQFVRNYDANPPMYSMIDAPCTAQQASDLARKYASGLTL